MVAYHETWRFASRDKSLHERMSHSFAGRAFLVVRSALRREMLLGLSRLWDTQRGAIKMSSIADDLENPVIVGALWPDMSVYYDEPRQTAAKAVCLIRKYEKGGANHSTLRRLRKLRNQHLAHHQVERQPIGTVEQDTLETEMEILYADLAKLISLLEHFVERTAYDPKETAGVYTYYANFFWEAVRGERTAGHPRHRAPL